MTLVAHAITTASTPPSGTQPGDYVIVVGLFPNMRNIPPTTSWLRHIGMGVFAGTYPSGGTIGPSGSLVIVIVYRPDEGEQLTAFVVPRFADMNTTGTINLPNNGDLWGIFVGLTSAPTWQGTYDPAVYNATYGLAYARLPGVDTGQVALSANRSAASYTLGLAVYAATGVSPDPSAWTQSIEGRARVVVGGTDISEHVISLEVVDELDAPGPTATLIVDRNALHPDLSGSPLQLAAPVEIVGLYRPVEATAWQEAPILIGRVGAIDPSRHEMLVQVYDASEELLSRWFEREIQLSGTERLALRLSRMLYAERVPVSIYEESIVSVSGTQRFGRRPIWELLRESAAYCGGSRLRWKYDYAAKVWRLALYTPDRSASTPTYTFGTNDIIDLGASRLGLEDIRNVAQIVYGPPTQRFILTAEDTTSIAQYGRRMARIEEPSDSVIDTQAEAQAFAAAVLADLAQPMRGTRLSIPWAPFVRVHDVVRVLADGHVLKQAVTGGVSRVRHRLSREEARTELEVQGNRNPGLYRYWLSREAGRPGVVAATPNWRPSVPITPSSVTATATPRGILVRWPEERDPHYVETLVYFGSSSSPPLWGRVSGTFVLITTLADGQPLVPGTTYYVRIAHRYRDGRVSAQSSTINVTAIGISQQNSFYVSQSNPTSIPTNGAWFNVGTETLSFTLNAPAIVLLGYDVDVRSTINVTGDSSPPTWVIMDGYTRLTQTSGPTIGNLQTYSTAYLGKHIFGTHALRGEILQLPMHKMHPFALAAGSYTVRLQAMCRVTADPGDTYSAYFLIYNYRIYAAVIAQ